MVIDKKVSGRRPKKAKKSVGLNTYGHLQEGGPNQTLNIVSTTSTLFLPLPHHWFWLYAQSLPTQLAKLVGNVPQNPGNSRIRCLGQNPPSNQKGVGFCPLGLDFRPFFCTFFLFFLSFLLFRTLETKGVSF